MCDCEKPFIEPKLPFKELIDGSIHYRTFSADTDPNDLVWHWDAEDRLISSDEPNGWKFQLDNELPIEFPRTAYLIPKGIYHRVIKGNGPLLVKVVKLQ